MISKSTHPRTRQRLRRKQRVRKKVVGSADRPRLAVFRSNRHIYAQVIDDDAGRTIVSASTLADNVAGGVTVASAGQVGAAVAERAKAAGVSRVVFDRGGYQYHGRVKALAEAARDAGLDF